MSKYHYSCRQDDVDALISGAKTHAALVDEMFCRLVYRELKIEKVIFNDPATIVFFNDGDKVVVKVQDGEEYDPEKGIAMAVTKKALGGKGNYYNQIRKCLKSYEYYHPTHGTSMTFSETMQTICDQLHVLCGVKRPTYDELENIHFSDCQQIAKYSDELEEAKRLLRQVVELPWGIVDIDMRKRIHKFIDR